MQNAVRTATPLKTQVSVSQLLVRLPPVIALYDNQDRRSPWDCGAYEQV